MVKIKKIKIWFVYKKVIDKSGRFSKVTREVIKLINGLERFYNKDILDLRAIEYKRFLGEHKKIKIDKKNLPTTLLNKKIFFTKKLPSVSKLKKEIKKFE
jgi:hypothetical protein